MKICSVQIKPFTGDIARNIDAHIKQINTAASRGADIIFFPELSLTGYEPTLAKELVVDQNSSSLDAFQQICDTKHITIGVGAPTRSHLGLHISMIIFQPAQPRQTYSKQHLHSDELPYFVNGQHQAILEMHSLHLAPAICYESLLPEHAAKAIESGAEIYLASVAKPAKGVSKAFSHYPEIARKYAMAILMSNSIGHCDDFISAGNSAVWDKNGVLLAQLNESQEGLLIFDTYTGEAGKWAE